MVPIREPFTITLAPTAGSPEVFSVTVPETVRVCAAAESVARVINRQNKCFSFINNYGLKFFCCTTVYVVSRRKESKRSPINRLKRVLHDYFRGALDVLFFYAIGNDLIEY